MRDETGLPVPGDAEEFRVTSIENRVMVDSIRDAQEAVRTGAAAVVMNTQYNEPIYHVFKTETDYDGYKMLRRRFEDLEAHENRWGASRALCDLENYLRAGVQPYYLTTVYEAGRWFNDPDYLRDVELGNYPEVSAMWKSRPPRP